MRILIRRIDNKKGTTAFIDRTLDAPTLRIGRGTDQELQLSDMRVALTHAEIEPLQGGPYRVEARTSNGVWVNGGPCPASRLSFDDTLDCGHFRLTVMKPDLGTDLAILVEEQQKSKDNKTDKLRFVTELRDTRLSRRGLAWAGFLVVLAAMLLVPLSLRYGTSAAGAADRSANSANHVVAWPSDHLWSSGPVSSAHAFFETDCASCHVEPFVQVRNEACLACHDTIHHHVNDLHLVAQPDFSGAACTDCHREHNGPDGTIVRQPGLCTDCHASPQERFPQSKLESVRSFSKEHPAFSPLVSKYDPVEKKFSTTPVAQGKGVVLEEDTNLKFPHELHLAAKGVDALGDTRVLKCADCHVPDRGQISFEPVTMEKHCAGCHRLEFDKENHPDRVVPHGQPAEVAAVLRDFYAAQALSGEAVGLSSLDHLPPTALRRRPGPTRPRASREAAAKWSEQQGEQAVRDVFNTRICTYCHVVSAGDDPELPWTIAPVRIKEHSMTGAWFDHKPHSVAPCSDCHKAEQSKESSDVLLPDISNCRDCHGDVGHAAQVHSDCIDCHRYHVEPAPLWDPQATQRRHEAETAHAKLMRTGDPE